MKKINIRQAGPLDVQPLAAISRQTFIETFQDYNTEEDLKTFLNEAYEPGKLLAELQNDESFFYFCEVDGQLAGYMKLNTMEAQSEQQGQDALEIERIYFLKEFQGQGLGSRFFDLAEKMAKQMKKQRIWLGVWEHNQQALAVYKKKGFVSFSEHIFQVGDDKQRDILMEKKI